VVVASDCVKSVSIIRRAQRKTRQGDDFLFLLCLRPLPHDQAEMASSSPLSV
jgi:hypothetical protein